MVTFILIELARRVAVGGRDIGGRVLGGRFEHTNQSYNYGLLFYCNIVYLTLLYIQENTLNFFLNKSITIL